MNKKNIIRLLFCIITTYIILNFLYHGSLEIFLTWLKNNPLLFVVNFLFHAGLSLVAISVFNYSVGIPLVALITWGLSLISFKKYSMRNSRLILNDIFQIDEILAIADKFLKINNISVIVISLVILLGAYYFKNYESLKFKRIQRLHFFTLGIIILIIIYFIPSDYAIENKGLFLDLSKNSAKSIYSEAISDSILESYQEKSINKEKENIRPNIIIIMSEGFWDLRHLKNVDYNQNLYQTFDQMSSEGISGYLETPEFGGGTSNVEFELLTGHSVHFFPPGYIFYNEEKDKEYISGLPSFFKELDYETTAIHTYESWFYNRENIYRSMGFDDFISSEDMSNPSKKGFYISDEVMTDCIIETLDSNENPQFIFGITMQNHGPYDDDRYGDKQVIELLTPSNNKRILETYGQGVYDADQSLKRLYNYIKSSDEKTLVMFFGDHLPVLGQNFKVYKEKEFIENNIDLKNKLKLSSVPFFIWSNFNESVEKVDLLNVSYIGSYILDYLDINNNPYFIGLSNLRKKLPVISRTYGINENNELIEHTSKEYLKYQEIYRNLQFKVLKKDMVDDGVSSQKDLIMQVGNRKALFNEKVIKIGNNLLDHPYRQSKNIMIPLKFTVEKLGGKVFWHNETKEIEVRINSREISWRRNENVFRCKNSEQEFIKPLEVVDSRTYISLKDFKKITGIDYKYLDGLIFFTDKTIRNHKIIKEIIKEGDNLLPLNTQKVEDKKNLWLKNNHLVAHALGGIGRYTYTNSIEGFNKAYANGIRMFEIDLMITSDSQLVLRHDWKNHWYKTFQQDSISLSDNETIIDFKTFKNLKMYNAYTPMSFKDIINLMNKYKDIQIIVDTKEENYNDVYEIINNHINESETLLTDRIIPQVYSESMLYSFNQLYDFQNVIFSLYKSNLENNEIVSLAKENNLNVITMSKDRYSKDLIRKLSNHNVKVFLHTVNSPELTQKYINEGVYGVYTDFLNYSIFKVIES